MLMTFEPTAFPMPSAAAGGRRHARDEHFGGRGPERDDCESDHEAAHSQIARKPGCPVHETIGSQARA
jgi:hypothetical protein